MIKTCEVRRCLLTVTLQAEAARKLQPCIFAEVAETWHLNSATAWPSHVRTHCLVLDSHGVNQQLLQRDGSSSQ